jgi:hypothetical protein
MAKKVASPARISVKKNEFARSLFCIVVSTYSTIVGSNIFYMTGAFKSEIPTNSATRYGGVGVVNPTHIERNQSVPHPLQLLQRAHWRPICFSLTTTPTSALVRMRERVYW